MIAVAIDENVDNVRAFMDGITYPVLMDVDHLLTELYVISNVPTVLMIDENDVIVQPNWQAVSTDTFKDFTGIDSADHLDIIRRWVLDDIPMMPADDAKGVVDDWSPDEERARLHFRIANHLRAEGDEAGAARNFDRAADLAPHDWTIRRAMLPLTGGDPFGEGYRLLAEEHDAAGRPYHGVSTPRR